MIAQSIPHAILSRRDGLAILLQRLEGELGSELQDRTRASARSFMRYHRGKGTSISDHIISFEASYQQATDHGLQLSLPMLSMMLVETAGLSPQQEEWVMSAVAGDWSQYAMIRRALRRLPSLDHRHGDGAGLWWQGGDGNA
jgi:hypothetical protein